MKIYNYSDVADMTLIKDCEIERWIDTKDCIVCKEDDICLGDPEDNLWRQFHEQNEQGFNGPFEIILIAKPIKL